MLEIQGVSAEIDLIVRSGGERVGIEVKRTDRPKLTASIRHAMSDLDLDRVIVVHAGAQRFPLASGVEAVPAADLLMHRAV